MDPLSDALTMLDMTTASPCRLEASGDWALRFDGYRHLRVGATLAGHGWLTVEGTEPMLLETGDCYLLSDGAPYTVGSDPAVDAADGQAVLSTVWPGTAYYNVNPDDAHRTIGISGAVTLEGTSADLLLDCLPPVVLIPAGSHRARVLRPVLQLLGEETSRCAPGAGMMQEHLTRILFVQVLRTLLINEGQLATGWLGALSDQRIGAALGLIHRQPARAWTVAELAAAANMSRSAFAGRYKALVGLPPLDYLARYRIHAARQALRHTDRTVGAIAAEFGYSSESAFSRACKRLTGLSPAQHRSRTPQ